MASNALPKLTSAQARAIALVESKIQALATRLGIHSLNREARDFRVLAALLVGTDTKLPALKRGRPTVRDLGWQLRLLKDVARVREQRPLLKSASDAAAALVRQSAKYKKMKPDSLRVLISKAQSAARRGEFNAYIDAEMEQEKLLERVRSRAAKLVAK